MNVMALKDGERDGSFEISRNITGKRCKLYELFQKNLS